MAGDFTYKPLIITKNGWKKKPKRYVQKFYGGPLNGQKLKMVTCGTITFTLNGETGCYDQNNKWIPKEE